MNTLRAHLLEGQAIPALPLALDDNRRWSQRHQRAVACYYIDAGAGGVAVGVHSTQFEIRDPRHGLFEPVLRLAAETFDEWLPEGAAFARICGLCGKTSQAVAEAALAKDLGYQAGLLSLAAWREDSEESILRHCRIVAESIPIIGFYLQPAVGGRALSQRFWEGFLEIENVVAIKIAPFNRYKTLDVIRALLRSGRQDVALYTGNDDNIIADLLTPFGPEEAPRYVVGGLLGQWGVWTRAAVAMLRELKEARTSGGEVAKWLRRNAELTDTNAAVFDAANDFAGCIPGIHEVLRRQGIFCSAACLNERETLSPSQAEELDRVSAAYPWLVDDDFVAANLHRWLA